MRVAATGPGENRHLRRAVQQPCRRRHIVLGCPDRGTFVTHVHTRSTLLGLLERDVAGEHQHRDAGLAHRGLNGNLEKARHLAGMRDHFAEVAAVGEEPFRMGLLEVSAAELGARYVRSDREDRDTASMTVVQAVDQVQVTGA